ncbi:hypothetical protein NIASO_17910 [Niabella soli DSM 19437]|uniref:Uncharacterized protein n=1 Tax=Niabella soli DSM 19437 TaxID=929713 RepID=W0F830_9BACT|nr:hypothetical protein NIASO_17910 [Niabella soli DSM 19437]
MPGREPGIRFPKNRESLEPAATLVFGSLQGIKATKPPKKEMELGYRMRLPAKNELYFLF